MISFSWDPLAAADSATKEWSDMGDRTNDLEKWILNRLKSAGVDGMDEDVLEEELSDETDFGSFVSDDFETLLGRLRARGVIDDMGCSGVRLSFHEWGRIIATAAGVDDFGEMFESLLKGSP